MVKLGFSARLNYAMPKCASVPVKRERHRRIPGDSELQMRKRGYLWLAKEKAYATALVSHSNDALGSTKFFENFTHRRCSTKRQGFSQFRKIPNKYHRVLWVYGECIWSLRSFGGVEKGFAIIR